MESANATLACMQALAAEPLISPLLADDVSRLPRCLVLTAGCDPLRDEGRAYSEKLLAAGVHCEYLCQEGAIHGFLSLAKSIGAGRRGLSLLAAKLREHLDID